MIAFSLCQFNVKHYNFVKVACSSCISYFCNTNNYVPISFLLLHTFLLTYIHNFWCNNVSAIQNFETIIYVSGPEDQPIHYFSKNYYYSGLNGYAFTTLVSMVLGDAGWIWVLVWKSSFFKALHKPWCRTLFLKLTSPFR